MHFSCPTMTHEEQKPTRSPRSVAFLIVVLTALVAGLVAPLVTTVPAQAATSIMHTFYITYVSYKDIPNTEAGKNSFLQQMYLDELIKEAGDYWKRETNGSISGFTYKWNEVQTLRLDAAYPIWGMSNIYSEQARERFPNVSFATGSANHILTIVRYDEAKSASGSNLSVRGVSNVGAPSLSGSGDIRLLLTDPTIDQNIQSWASQLSANLAHEVGHNLGLNHAMRTECQGSAYDGPFSREACKLVGSDDVAFMSPYGDSLDDTLLSYHRSELGLLDNGGRLDLSDAYSGDVTLTAVEVRDFSNVNEVRIVDPVDPTAMYSIEYRKSLGVRVLRVFMDTVGTGVLSPVLASQGGTAGSLMQPKDSFTSASGKFTFSVTSVEGDKADIHLNVVPVACDPALRLSLTTWTPSAAGGWQTVHVLSNMEWRVSGLPEWISSSDLLGSGDGGVRLVAQENTASATRQAFVTVSSTVANSVKCTVSVVQRAKGALSLWVSPTIWSAPAGGGSQQVTIITRFWNGFYGLPSWLHTQFTSGSSGGPVVTIDPNTTGRERTASIDITAAVDDLRGVWTITITQPPQAVPPVLTVSAPSPTVAAGGSSQVETVTSNVDWTVSGLPTWLSSNVLKGTGNGSFTLTATANTTTSSRTATLTVTTSSGSPQVVKTVTVTQPAQSLSVSPSSWTAPSVGGTSTETVKSNIGWTVSVPLAVADWLSSSKSSGTNDGSFTLTAYTNRSGQERTAMVTVAGGGLSRTITVTQPAQSLSVSPSSWAVLAGGGSQNMSVTSNMAWTVSVPSTASEWLSSDKLSGSNNGSFMLTAQPNTTSLARSVTLTVSGGGLSRTVTVTQPAQPTLTLSPSSWAAPSTGGTQTEQVTSNGAWTVSIPSVASGWLSSSKLSDGNNGSFVLTATANTTSSPRSVSVTVSGGGLSRTVTVTQPIQPTLTVAPPSPSVTAGGSSQIETVTSNTSWSVSIPSDGSWLTSDKSSGSGNGSFTLSAAANTTGSQRQVTVTVKTTSGSPQVVKTVMVTQPAQIVLTVAPASPTVTAGGSSQVETVTSNVDWTVSGLPTWLSSNVLKGTGNGSFTLTATANTTTSLRTATLTVSGGGLSRTVTVTQPAQSLSVTPSSWSAPSTSGSQTEQVTSNTAWTVSGLPTWLSSNALKGTGNGSFTLTATANTTGSERSVTLTVAATGGSPSQTVKVTQPAQPTLTVSPSSWTAPAGGSSPVTENVTSNTTWSVSGAPDWLKASVSTGSGNGSFTVTASPNATGGSRTGTVTVKTTSVSPQVVKTVTVTQPAPVTLTVAPLSPTIVAGGGSQVETVTSNTGWTVSVGSDASKWLSSGTLSGSGNGSFTLTATANTTGASRTGTVVVAASGGSPSQTVTVTQPAQSPTLTVTPSSWSASYLGGSSTEKVTSNTTWEVVIPQDASGWLSSSVSKGTGSGSFTLTATPYDVVTEPRSATVTVRTTSGSPQVVRTVTVSQQPQNLLFWLPDFFGPRITWNGGTARVNVVSNTSWSVSGAPDWLKPSTLSGSGNETFTVTATANTTDGSRTGVVTVKTTSGSPEMTMAISVTQPAQPQTLTVSPSSWTAPSVGGTQTVQVTSNTSWRVTGLPDWVSADVVSGSGAETVTLTAKPNITGQPRSVTVTVTGGTPAVTQTIKVDQDPYQLPSFSFWSFWQWGLGIIRS